MWVFGIGRYPFSSTCWIIHGAKVVVTGEEEEHTPVLAQKDRDHLRMASFGRRNSEANNAEAGLPVQVPGLARIHVSRMSLCRVPTSIKSGISKTPSDQCPASNPPENNGDGRLLRVPCSMYSHSLTSTREGSGSQFRDGTQEPSSLPDGKELHSLRESLIDEVQFSM